MAIEAPTGLVTFAFTDIQGSTSLWEQDVEAMKRAVELHDELMTRLLEEHGGYLVRTEGDSVKAAFASPVAALRWCLAAQSELLEVDWPPGLLRAAAAAEERGPDGGVLFRGLRVRMGIHTGHADPRVVPATGRMDYFGPDVNTAARVADAPHGGQVIMSGPAWEAMAGQVRDEVACRDLGDHELKGVALPVRLLEVTPPRLSGRSFPAPRTRSARRTNVSSPGNDFVGRVADLTSLGERLSASRLVTIVGPGGTGKTRLARELGVQVSEAGTHQGGVWFADLAGADEAGRMVSAVASAISVSLPLGTDPASANRIIGGHLARLGPCLLMLDNLEQILAPATAAVREWLAAAQELRILVTSQAPLQLGGEAVHNLAPLGTEAAVELFVARARERGVELPDDADTRQTIRQIVEELDGLSLAVELAAARTDVLSVDAIRKRLSQKFRLLSRSGQGRHDAIRSALDWSWDLLSEDERRTLAHCSVFDGGFTVEAAEAVVDLGDSDNWPMDVVQALRVRSLLVAETVDEERRLGMLRLVRAYAAEKLLEMGDEEAAAAVDRHARYFADLTKRYAAAQFGPRSGDALLQLRREIDNVLAVWTRKHETDPLLAARVATHIGRFLVVSGVRADAISMFDEAVAAAQGHPELEVDARMVRAYAYRMGADAAVAVADLEVAREVAESHGLARHRVDVALDLGAALYHVPDRRAEGIEWLRKAVEGYDALGEHGRGAVARSWVGITQFQSDPAGADELLQEAGRLADAHAGTPEQVLVLARQFIGAMDAGRLDEAREMSRRAFIWQDRIGSQHDCCTNLLCLAIAEVAAGDHEALAAAANAAAERASRLDAAGLRAAAEIMVDAARVLLADGPIDGMPPEEWYRKRAAPLFEPGPPDERHPEGTLPLIQASVWCGMVVDYIQRFSGLAAQA